MANKVKTRHGSYYINVAQVLGVLGAIAVAWKYADILEKQGGISLDPDTVKHVSDNIASAIRWRSIWG